MNNYKTFPGPYTGLIFMVWSFFAMELVLLGLKIQRSFVRISNFFLFKNTAFGTFSFFLSSSDIIANVLAGRSR
jgi:hypothetical protein